MFSQSMTDQETHLYTHISTTDMEMYSYTAQCAQIAFLRKKL